MLYRVGGVGGWGGSDRARDLNLGSIFSVTQTAVSTADRISRDCAPRDCAPPPPLNRLRRSGARSPLSLPLSLSFPGPPAGTPAGPPVGPPVGPPPGPLASTSGGGCRVRVAPPVGVARELPFDRWCDPLGAFGVAPPSEAPPFVVFGVPPFRVPPFRVPPFRVPPFGVPALASRGGVIGPL